MKRRHVSVGDVRSIGLFGAIELVKSRKTKEAFVPYGGSHPAVAAMNAFLKNKGIYAFTAGHVLHTNPPLIITEVYIMYTAICHTHIFFYC
jgi:taurine--2-oxoglutarate transaminase